MQLVIVAGGKGTRLGLTDIPKPMCPIGSKPLLEHQIELAKRYGVDEIFILSGHLAHVIRNYFGDGTHFGVPIHHMTEPFPLGTAGSLKLLEGKLRERFMVFYGDVVMDFDLAAFREFDSRFPASVGTLVVHPNNHPDDSDLVAVEGDRVTALIPKPHPADLMYHNLTNAAVYIFSPAVFSYIAANQASDLGRDVLPRIVADGGEIRAYATAEFICDMGTPERLERIEQDFLSGRIARRNRAYARPAVFLDRDGVLNPDMGTRPRASDFQLLPGVAEAVRSLNDSDYLAVVVTNQPMIAKGFITQREVKAIHRTMETLLGRQGAYLNGIFFCPHHPDKGFPGEVPELKTDCSCRKPKPGMLLRAADRFHIDLRRSWMIGDSPCDIAAGQAAGCHALGVGPRPLQGENYHCPDLASAVLHILREKEKDMSS